MPGWKPPPKRSECRKAPLLPGRAGRVDLQALEDLGKSSIVPLGRFVGGSGLRLCLPAIEVDRGQLLVAFEVRIGVAGGQPQPQAR